MDIKGEIMGKAYANKKTLNKRPQADFYETPKCMTEELIKTGVLDGVKTIWDPCCGKFAITDVLEKHGFTCFKNDIMYGDDYFANDYQKHECIVMNPPFMLFDKFVEKAKKEADLVCVIGKANYFGSHSRNINGLWQHLREVYFFDRQIAYDKPLRADGKVECGMMITGWFIWDMSYNGKPTINVIDMNEYILRKGRK
jgi:hypothetical protein